MPGSDLALAFRISLHIHKGRCSCGSGYYQNSEDFRLCEAENQGPRPYERGWAFQGVLLPDLLQVGKGSQGPEADVCRVLCLPGSTVPSTCHMRGMDNPQKTGYVSPLGGPDPGLVKSESGAG